MKLPDFLAWDEFIRLKKAMGIPSDQLGNLRAVEVRRDGATWEEIRQLAEEGLDVDKKDVVPLPDGTLSYKDRRVLIYIRDISQYGSNNFTPRFHFADCTTVRQMRENQRFSRFVTATREDGVFQLRYIDIGREKEERLDVCQNCLDRLKYKSFQLGMPQNIRRAAVQQFSIAEFFSAYPKSLHHSMPIHNAWTAPTNDYSEDQPERSAAYRQKKNWVCEKCGIPLSKPNMRRYLHVHHVNVLKYDNREENFKALCVHCHGEERSHGHMRATREYRDFEGIWQRWRRTAIAPG